jgi:HEAT repeat protein
LLALAYDISKIRITSDRARLQGFLYNSLMADGTLSKLTQLMAGGDKPMLRRAAVMVAGTVATARDKGVVQALLANLQDPDADLRIASIEAMGNLHVEESLGSLENFVRQGGPELEAAVQAASQLGARGVRAMGKIMNDATPAQRSRIAAVLARSGTGGGLVVTAHALLDPDPKVVDAAARSLAGEVPAFSTAQKQALTKFLCDSLKAKKELAAKTEAAMLRLLGTLHETKAAELFWSRLDADESSEVRGAALQALGQIDSPPNDAKLKRLVACAADSDFQIVAPALMILNKVPASAKNVKAWLGLLEAHDVATRQLAVEKLSGVESAEAVRGLLGQLAHPDRSLRDSAQQALLRFGKGRQALLEKLIAAATVDECWDLARTLGPVAKEFAKSARQQLLDQAARHQDQDDRRATPMWHLLRDMDIAWTRTQLEALAQARRQKKKYPQALGYYKLLIQDPAAGEDIRFELAATGLKLSSHDLAVEARQTDHALGQFSRVLQNPSFDVVARVKQAKWLDAADLFYLGFHFVEQMHRAHDFGTQVLELVVKRWPKTETGKSAKKKLASAG